MQECKDGIVAQSRDGVTKWMHGLGIEIIQTFSQLLSTVETAFESGSAPDIALHQYRQTAADFADCRHTALADRAGEEALWTFDKVASRVQGARHLVA